MRAEKFWMQGRLNGMKEKFGSGEKYKKISKYPFSMAIKDTPYWERKRKFRPNITDDLIEYCIQNSNIMRDRDDPTAFNAIARIPPSGRILKVAYGREGKDLKIITAYWLD